MLFSAATQRIAEDQETIYTQPSEKLCLADGEKKKELGELTKQLRSDDDERVHIVANDSRHDTAWS